VILSAIGCSRPPPYEGEPTCVRADGGRDVLVTRVVLSIVFVAAKAGAKTNLICLAPDLAQAEVGH
jgi:hypothetical protein